jgi:RHS repeat-associated protein
MWIEDAGSSPQWSRYNCAANWACVDEETERNELLSASGAENASFAYTPNGGLRMKTQAGVTWTYAYNERRFLREVKRNEIVQATYPYADGTTGMNTLTSVVKTDATTSFTYDPNGNLDANTGGWNHDWNFENLMTLVNQNGNQQQAYLYDGLGRVRTETTTLPGLPGSPFQLGYEYDAAGRITYLTYPDGWLLYYGYDALGRTSSASWIDGVARFAHYPDDLLKDFQTWSRVTQSFTYSVRGWPTSIKASKFSKVYLDLAYTYDDSGNVKTMGSASFTYDKLDRLGTASGGFGSHTYAYDALGNRDRLDGTDPVTYGYNTLAAGMNELTSLTRGGQTTSFFYDKNLNLRSKVTGSSRVCYDWDFENLLDAVRQLGSTQSCDLDAGSQVQRYQYDGLGRRVKAEGADSATWTASIFSGLDVLFERDSTGTVRRYVRANGLLIARIDCPAGGSCATYWYLADHLGSTKQVRRHTDRSLVFSAEYDPFGKVYAVTGTEAYRYTGEKHDDPTGLVYLRARQYDPDLGRFVSLDPVLGALAVPQTLNRYAYVVNNPLKYTDPTGEFIPLLILAGLLIGAAIGGASYGYHVATTGAAWDWGQFAVSVGIGALGGAVAGATFGLGAAALGVTSMAGLAGLGYGTMFLLGGIASVAGYTAERAGIWGLTGEFHWDPWEAAGAFALGGALAMAGKWLGPRIANWWRNWRTPRWPSTATEMDSLLGFRGRPIADTPATPGRGRIVWDIGGNRQVIGEQHLYLAVRGASPAKQAWHWHYEPGHYTGYPGDLMPSWLVRILRLQGYL